MNYEARRQAVLDGMEENSLLILYSGEAVHRSADAYHHFEENKHFFYLTGLRRENMVLVMKKVDGSRSQRGALDGENGDGGRGQGHFRH